MGAKAVSFVGRSGSGKTTLLEKVIAELVRRGTKLGAIKHDAHRFEIDHPGKDSYRLAAAGAAVAVICSGDKLALVRRLEATPPVEEIISAYFADVDLVLAEGFKGGPLPKIEVHRRQRGAELLCRGVRRDPTLIAVASDEPLEIDVPVLDVNDPAAVAEFLAERFLER